MTYPLLNAREKTDLFERKLLQKFSGKTLAVIRANIPGGKKGSLESNWIVYKIFLTCKKKLNPSDIFHSYTNEEGLIFFLIINGDPLKIKKKAIKIENMHPLGRLSDIDILNSEKLFSRSDIFFKNKEQKDRKCFLCGKSAKVCARNKTHSKTELMEFINNTVHNLWLCRKTAKKNYMQTFKKKAFILSSFTEVSLLGELCRVYGFGCVTANGNGSHADMDFLLMLRCIPLISSSIKKMKKKDYKNFYSLRKYGKKIEKKLFTLTDGVNTYKGAIFLLLILNACACKLKKRNGFFSNLHHEIKTFSGPVKNDLTSKNCSTASLNLFLYEGQKGVRGEVLSGFDEHFKLFLPFFKKIRTNEDYPVESIILQILCSTWDTTIINRRGKAKLDELQKRAKEICKLQKEISGQKNEEHNNNLLKNMSSLSKWCIEQNISTGGTADRIIILYNLFLLEKFWNTVKSFH